MKLGVGADKSTIQNFSFCSGGNGTSVAVIDVKDNKIIRTRPFVSTEKYTAEEMRLWKIKSNDGREYSASEKSVIPPFAYVYKHRLLSKNRMLYPMRREDWSPENRNPKNRGVSKFVRISWDEALDTISSEIRRQYDVYGAGSIFVQCDGHGQTRAVHGPHGCMCDLLDILGGFSVQMRNADSWEGWYWGAKHVWYNGHGTGLGLQGNLLLDITQNCDMLVVWGGDADTTPLGWGGMCASRFLFWCTQIGVKQVYVCPDVNYSCACHADKWIPIYPNTDQALQWAIVNIWCKEGTYDQEYLDTHAIGFDFIKAHALGWDEDKLEKTPEWASELTGVPVYTIKALARQMHLKRTTIAHGNGGSYIRAAFSHEPARMEVVLLAMQGLGKPGRNQFRMVEWGHYGKANAMPFPRPEICPNIGAAYNGSRNMQPDNFIPKTLIQQGLSIEEGETQWWFATTQASYPLEDQFVEYCYPPEEDAPLVHMIWSDTPCHSTCWNHGNGNCAMYRSERIDFILCQHPWLENDMIYADMLLPVNTVYQGNDINIDVFGGDMVKVYIEEKCIDQVCEEYSDWEISCMIAERMGLLEEFTESTDEEFYMRRGWERCGVGDRMSFEEFKEKEYYVVPTDENWEDTPHGFQAFYENPAAHPLLTPTGYLELYSASLAEYFPDDKERRPYPFFIDESEEHHETLHSDRAEQYPFLLVSNHPHWRVHAQMDDIPWTREIEPCCKIEGPDGYKYEPIWVNPADAERLGIAHGDICKLYNERGWVLGAAWVTERIMPGVLSQDHGARIDPIEPGVSDRGGANNLICPLATTSKNCAGEVTSGFLVGIEKVDVLALAEQYPEAFNRPYDPEYGLVLDTWVKEA